MSMGYADGCLEPGEATRVESTHCANILHIISY